VSGPQQSRTRTGRSLPHLLLAIGLGVSLQQAPFASGDPVQKKSTTKAPAKQAAQVPASLLRAVRATISESARVKKVSSPRSGVVRIVLDQSLVKETEYRTALVGTCNEILKAKAQRLATTLEIVSADERQGYVYRPTTNCAEVIAADDDRRRMVILPQTTVFRAPR
jgi:hypothetical protein